MRRFVPTMISSDTFGKRFCHFALRVALRVAPLGQGVILFFLLVPVSAALAEADVKQVVEQAAKLASQTDSGESTEEPVDVSPVEALAPIKDKEAPSGQEPAKESIEEATDVIRLEVDATSVHRHLLRSEMTFPTKAGEQVLWYPQWIPGVAGPTGLIANVAGIVFTDESGKLLKWRRDSTQLNRFIVTIPKGVQRLRVKLTYLANQPTPYSAGVDSYGTRQLLSINFNTCVLYPEGNDIATTPVAVRVKIPRDWKTGCAIRPVSSRKTSKIDLGTVSLKRLVDSPFIAGKHFKEISLNAEGAPPTRLYLVGDTRSCTNLSKKRIAMMSRVIQESFALFGNAPFEEYAFLIICSDRLPRFGLEHSESSLNSIRAMALRDDRLYRYRPAYLLPHEAVHAWCGKYRLPEGMDKDDFHSPLDTELLWVYEGLTQYLMQLVAVRSGQIPLDYHYEYMAYQISDQLRRAGRSWRSLSDTAVSAPTLRNKSSSWSDLRRGQDYYGEGALFWLNVDCLLREKSDGKVSIDDFCQAFFTSDQKGASPNDYNLEDIVATLDKLVSYNWKRLIRRQVYLPRTELAMDGIVRAGYQIGWSHSKPEFIRTREKVLGRVQAVNSLGIEVQTRGKILRVVPGSVADKARLREQADIVAVNRRTFSVDVLNQELAAADASNKDEMIELIVRDGQWFAIHELKLREGPRHAILEKRDDSNDLLSEIFLGSPREEKTAEESVSKNAIPSEQKKESDVTAQEEESSREQDETVSQAAGPSSPARPTTIPKKSPAAPSKNAVSL